MSWAPTISVAPIPSPAREVSSQGIWVMACWPISAIRRPSNMTPNAPSAPGCRWSRRCRSSRPRAREPLQVRVGIATGLVVVGDLIGIGAGTGTDRRRRDAEPCRAVAGAGRAGHGGDLVEHTSADRRPVRIPRSRDRRAQGLCREDSGMAGAGRKRLRKPLRGAARQHDAAHRSRRGGRTAVEPLAAGESRRGLGRPSLWRARHRQIADCRDHPRAPGRRATCAPARVLLAPPPGHGALSEHRAAGTGRRLPPR